MMRMHFYGIALTLVCPIQYLGEVLSLLIAVRTNRQGLSVRYVIEAHRTQFGCNNCIPSHAFVVHDQVERLIPSVITTFTEPA